MLLVVAFCAVTCRPTEKDESSIHKHPSLGIVHIRFVSDTGVDELLGIFNPEALERSLEKLPEKIPSSDLDKPIENPLDQKKSEPNVERPPMEKDVEENPVRLIDEKERETNPINLPEQKEREPILENPLKGEDIENVSPEREQIRQRREVPKSPLLTDLHEPKLLHESPGKLQEQKVGKDFIKKQESHHSSPVETRFESKHGESENINPEKPRLGSEKLNPEKPRLGSENVNLEKPKLGSENVNLEKPKLGSENVNLEEPKLGSENVNPKERKERPDVLKEPEEQPQKERSDESKESEEERKSESFPSILLPPRVMSKRRRSILDGLPVGDDGRYDERSHYRLPGSTDVQFNEDRPRYGTSGTYGDMSRYRVDDPYGYGRPGGMDRPIYDDRYKPYATDTLVDIQMK